MFRVQFKRDNDAYWLTMPCYHEDKWLAMIVADSCDMNNYHAVRVVRDNADDEADWPVDVVYEKTLA